MPSVQLRPLCRRGRLVVKSPRALSLIVAPCLDHVHLTVARTLGRLGTTGQLRKPSVLCRGRPAMMTPYWDLQVSSSTFRTSLSRQHIARRPLDTTKRPPRASTTPARDPRRLIAGYIWRRASGPTPSLSASTTTPAAQRLGSDSREPPRGASRPAQRQTPSAGNSSSASALTEFGGRRRASGHTRPSDRLGGHAPPCPRLRSSPAVFHSARVSHRRGQFDRARSDGRPCWRPRFFLVLASAIPPAEGLRPPSRPATHAAVGSSEARWAAEHPTSGGCALPPHPPSNAPALPVPWRPSLWERARRRR